jgi:multiple sugar transport system permease protein
MSVTAQRPTPAVPLPAARVSRRRSPRETRNSFLLTFVAIVLLAGFLSPLLRSFALSFQTPEQISQVGAPLWPASPRTYEYQGRSYDLFVVQVDGVMKELALVNFFFYY